MAGWPAAAGMVAIGSILFGTLLQTLLSEQLLATAYLSPVTWIRLVDGIGGQLDAHTQTAVLPETTIGLLVLGVAVAAWVGGAFLLARWDGSRPEWLARWGIRGWRWWLLSLAWCGAWYAAVLAGARGLAAVLAASSPLAVAVILNLWIAEWFALQRQACAAPPAPPVDPAVLERRTRRLLAVAIALYTATFTAMNWGLWFNLQIPHGDSAMYEEHLWNVTHGKGFRSYLDQGLFLGEHVQVIHLLLLPLYLLWPSHLLLELCESLALGLTAVPVYCITRRHSGSPWAALYLGAAVLLYFPLQTLDIAIDFKTFRPSAFGIPLLLAAIDQMERRRWKTMGLFILLTLSVQEDFAIPVSLLGLWMAATGDRSTTPHDTTGVRRVRWIGAVMWLFSAAYLLLVLKVVLPWFRDGATIHYARYFPQFGETPTEIAWNMLTHPGQVLAEVVTASNVLYALYLLAPLGFLPVLSPGRLLVGLPLFGLLCLNELSRDPPGPFHHFHAPLLPILFWSAAAGLSRLARMGTAAAGMADNAPPAATCSAVRWNTAVCGARFALGCALLGSACYTLSPLGTRFWDPGRIVAGRPTWWRALYLPDERARAWERVAPLIPPTARVASTDFVHPRLTHCERSYDYSRYARRVAGYEDRIPDDADYIVIDLQHAYSRDVLGNVASAADVRELREHPDEWELLTDPRDRYFVVLRRRAAGG